jgi:hypothetical protein
MRGRSHEFGPKRRKAACSSDRGCCPALAFRGSVFQLVSLFFHFRHWAQGGRNSGN